MPAIHHIEDICAKQEIRPSLHFLLAVAIPLSNRLIGTASVTISFRPADLRICVGNPIQSK